MNRRITRLRELKQTGVYGVRDVMLVVLWYFTMPALHLHAAHVAEFGSFQFYSEVISSHPDFEEVDCVDTVSMIQRVK